MNNQTKSFLQNAGYLICMVYVSGFMLSFTYFSWQFAFEHGFVAWLFFGEIVPMLKAAVWPIWFFV